MSITLKTHKMLWGRSANRCAFPDCGKILVEDETETDDEAIVGDEAHIVAREPFGPRGDSPLTPKQRDKYDNLVLLCKIHHKIIDDQYNRYSVDVLHKMKEDHLSWVNDNLRNDIDKQKDDEIYATYIDEVLKLARMNSWRDWSSFVLGHGQPEISLQIFEDLNKLNGYILSRVWINRYPDLESSFHNFRLILNDFLKVFNKYAIKVGNEETPILMTEKIYHRLTRYDEQEYKRLFDKFEFNGDLVEDLMLELTRAGNYLFEQVRRFISSSFRLNEGVLMIITGPDENFEYKSIRVEYRTKVFEELRYKGLAHFMEIRSERDIHFGHGTSSDYLPSSP